MAGLVAWVAGLQERVRLCHGRAHAQSLRPASRSRLPRCMRVRGNFALETSRWKLRCVAFVARATGIRCCPCVAEMGGGGAGGGAAGAQATLPQACACPDDQQESLHCQTGAGVRQLGKMHTLVAIVANIRAAMQRECCATQRFAAFVARAISTSVNLFRGCVANSVIVSRRRWHRSRPISQP